MVVSVVNELPDCVLLRIFKHCESRVDLWRARIVCRRWYVLLADSELWRVCNLSSFKFDDSRLLVHIVKYMPMNGLQYLEISKNIVMTESMQVILEAANKLKGLRLNDCELRPDITKHFTPLLTSFVPRNLSYLDIRKTKGDLRILKSIFLETGASIKVLGVSNSIAPILILKLRPFLYYVRNLTVFECFDCTWANDATICDIANSCPSLRSLNVTKCLNIQGTSIEKLIRKCTQLKTLVLRRTSIREEEMLKANWTNAQITELDISHCYYLDDSACLHIVQILASRLEYLSCAFTDQLVQGIKSMKLPIRTLELRRRHPLNMKHVIELLSNCVAIETLDLSSSPVDYETFEEILPNLPNLKWLSFAGHEVLKTVDSLSMLLTCCEHLEYVGINYYHATCHESIYEDLFNFAVNCKHLKILNIEGAYMDDVYDKLYHQIAFDKRFRNRNLKITKCSDFELPTSELSVDSIGKVLFNNETLTRCNSYDENSVVWR